MNWNDCFSAIKPVEIGVIRARGDYASPDFDGYKTLSETAQDLVRQVWFGDIKECLVYSAKRKQLFYLEHNDSGGLVSGYEKPRGLSVRYIPINDIKNNFGEMSVPLPAPSPSTATLAKLVPKQEVTDTPKNKLDTWLYVSMSAAISILLTLAVCIPFWYSQIIQQEKTHQKALESQEAKLNKAHAEELASQEAELNKAHDEELANQKAELNKAHDEELASQKAELNKAHDEVLKSKDAELKKAEDTICKLKSQITDLEKNDRNDADSEKERYNDSEPSGTNPINYNFNPQPDKQR